MKFPFVDDRKEVDKAYRFLFATREGRIVLADLLSWCGIDRSTFDRDPQLQAYKNGKRDVGLHLMEILHTNTQAFTEELKES